MRFFKSKFILLLFMLYATFSTAQNGVKYQGVAVDNQNFILSEQTIKIKLQLVYSSNPSIVEWEEVHEITTNNCGLFEVDLGRGIRVDGVSSFEFINWTSNTYLLNVFLDENNIGNYTLLGSNRINAVPYAIETPIADESRLEKQQLSYDSTNGKLELSGNDDSDEINILNTIHLSDDGDVLDYLSSNGSVISSIALDSNPFGRRTANFDFPEGQDGTYMFLDEEVYIVPANKNLYLINADAQIDIKSQGVFQSHFTTPNMPILSGGDTLKNCKCSAMIVDRTDYLEPVMIDFGVQPAYIVPENKVFFLKSGLDNDDSIVIKIDGANYKFMKPNEIRGTMIITIPGGHILNLINSQTENIVTGYLVSPK